MNNVQIGRKSTAIRGEFLEPKREVFVYFGSDENPTFGAGVCRIPPLSSNEEHDHPDADEILYVISGEMRMVIDDETEFLSQGDAIFIPKGQVHHIFNPSPAQDLWHTFTFSPPGPEAAIKRGYGDTHNFRLLSS